MLGPAKTVARSMTVSPESGPSVSISTSRSGDAGTPIFPRRLGLQQGKGLDDAHATLALGRRHRLRQRDDRLRDGGLGLLEDDRRALVRVRPQARIEGNPGKQ